MWHFIMYKLVLLFGEICCFYIKCFKYYKNTHRSIYACQIGYTHYKKLYKLIDHTCAAKHKY